MTHEEIKKTNAELKEEIKRNNEKIIINDERTRMANVNKFEYKALKTLGLSVLPYLCIFISSALLTKNGAMTSITSTIPIESLPLIIVGSSLGIGTIVGKLLERKYKTKERFKSFTNAKSQSEKLQEQVKYAIELEKARNRNKAIKQTMDSLNSKQSVLNSLSIRYNISDKALPQTKEESQKRVEELSILLKEKYNELDILTTQQVLHDKFLKVRIEGQKSIYIMLSGMMGGVVAMFYFDLPLIMLKNSLIYSSISPNILSVLTPLIAGVVGLSGYMIKRNKDYEKAFNILNRELGENALPNKIKEAYYEKQEIDGKIESKMREISITGIQLQEQKRIMESFIDDSNKKENTLESSNAKEHIIEETIIDTTIGRNQEDLFASIYKNIYDSEERKQQIEEKGHSLVLRKNYNSKDKK